MRSPMATREYSIIIPTLNEEKFLPKLLTSLTCQTQKNFDVIVVDGASVDKTVAVAKTFQKKLPLTIVECKKAGVSRQRNIGAKKSQAKWLVFVDADSILLPRFIERVSEFIKNDHPRFFTTALKPDRLDTSHKMAAGLFNRTIQAAIVIGRPWAPGPLTVVARDAFNRVGGYNEQVVYGEDHELGAVMHKRGIPFCMLRQPLYIYSFRRFRKEGTLKTAHRTIASTLNILVNRRGLRKAPGLVSGGLMYNEKSKRKKNFSKDVERRIRRLIAEFVAV